MVSNRLSSRFCSSPGWEVPSRKVLPLRNYEEFAPWLLVVRSRHGILEVILDWVWTCSRQDNRERHRKLINVALWISLTRGKMQGLGLEKPWDRGEARRGSAVTIEMVVLPINSREDSIVSNTQKRCNS